MKNSLKKSLVLCAVSAMLIITSANAIAAPTVRPMPGTSQTNTVTSSGTSTSDETGVADDDADTDEDDASDNNAGENPGVTRIAPTPVPVAGDGQVNIVTDAEKSSGKKGVSVGAMILWLLLSVIINAGVSFWIGNRFYRLSKKDTHLTAEIRALRRDVEEKFLLSVGGFAEQETDISNTNEDYSRSDNGITMPRRQRDEEVSGEEADEILRQWESRQANPRTSNVRRKYQPTREEIGSDETNGADKSPIKNKAKEILGDIFPFRED